MFDVYYTDELDSKSAKVALIDDKPVAIGNPLSVSGDWMVCLQDGYKKIKGDELAKFF